VANMVPNIGLGRAVQLYKNVDENNPANSALIVSLWNTAAADSVIRDLDTLADLEANASTAEIVLSGYARKVLTDADLTAFSPDDTNDRADLDIPDQTWTAVAAGTITDLSVAYDNDTTGGADSAIDQLTWHDFAVTADGSDLTAVIASAGFFRATSAT
jgi:hypothetical protein